MLKDYGKLQSNAKAMRSVDALIRAYPGAQKPTRAS
jgi:hypothetical protein